MSRCGHDEWEEWMDYCTQCGESSLRVIVAEKRIRELEAENARLREGLAGLSRGLGVKKQWAIKALLGGGNE